MCMHARLILAFIVFCFVCFLFCLDFIVCTGNNSACALDAVELLDCVDVSVIYNNNVLDIHNYSLVPRPPRLALLDAI